MATPSPRLCPQCREGPPLSSSPCSAPGRAAVLLGLLGSVGAPRTRL